MEQKEGKLFSTKEMHVLWGEEGNTSANQKNQKRAATWRNKHFIALLIGNLYSAL